MKQSVFGKVPNEWDIISFDNDGLEIIDGDRGENYPKNDELFTSGDCLFLNARNFEHDEFCFDEAQFISKEKDNRLRKGKLVRGDFVLTTRGTVGSIAYYGEDVPFDHLRINSGMVILRIDPTFFDPVYFYQFLKSKCFKDQIIKFVSGTAQPQLPIRDLKQMSIIAPSLPEQKNIGRVLNALDQKIRFLRNQNNLYKKMSQALFARWFFEYEFPDGKGNPYSSSRGKMVDSESGDIPEGWLVCKFGDILERLSDRIGRDDQSKYVVLSAVKTGDLVLSEEYFSKQVFSKDISKYIKLQKDDFAYNPARINIGSIGKLEADIQGAVSPVYVAFRAKDNFTHFVSFLIKTQKTRRHIDYFANGSVRQSLSYDDFAFMDIVKPPEDVLKAFNETYECISKRIRVNNQQIDTLSKMLDTLMPKLLTGEIRVNA
jgi:type I restriction enzyme S subunit